MKKARIIGLGKFLPQKRLTNQDLEKLVETTDEWIVSRTGIKERRIAAPEEPSSVMGLKAAEEAIKKASIDKTAIDLIICATMSPDYLTPSTAALIQSELKIPQAPAYDCQAACTGFLFALSQAKAFIESGIYKNILVVASEKMSAYIDYQDRNTCVLFGDGAAAAVVSSEGAGFLIDEVTLGSDGSLGHLIIVPGGGSKEPATLESIEKRSHYIKMEGREVFKHAVRQMGKAVEGCLERAKLDRSQISWLVPHQANLRIIDSIASTFSIPKEKVYMTLEKYGNTSGSSVAIALTELTEEKDLKSGEHLILVAFGAGLTWGATLLTKVDS